MNGIIIYLIGWLILSICYYVYEIHINRYSYKPKKLYIWKAFWTGIFSWIGIFFISASFIVIGIFTINEWVEEKLSK